MEYHEKFKIYLNLCKNKTILIYNIIKTKVKDFLLIPNNIQKINLDIENIYERIVHMDNSINELKEIDFVAIGK